MLSDERYICFEVLFDKLHPPPPVHAGMKLFGGSVTAVRFSSLDNEEPSTPRPLCAGENVHPDDDKETP